MNALLLSIALKSIQWWIGNGIFDRIRELVLVMMNTNMTGAEKNAYVVSTVKREFINVAGTAIRAVIELYLLRVAVSTKAVVKAEPVPV